MTSFNLFAKVVCVNEPLQYTSCMCFVTVDKLEYRVIIEFFILDELTSKEIHLKLPKVYGNSAPSTLTFKKVGS